MASALYEFTAFDILNAEERGRTEIMRQVAALNPYKSSAGYHCWFCGLSALLPQTDNCVWKNADSAARMATQNQESR